MESTQYYLSFRKNQNLKLKIQGKEKGDLHLYILALFLLNWLKS